MTQAPARPRSRLWRVPEIAALSAAFLLLIGGLATVIYSERFYEQQKLKEVRVQVEILADSLSAPLAFDDNQTAQDYVNALRANPDIEASAVYDETGMMVASYTSGPNVELPTTNIIRAAPHLENGRAVAAAPVRRGESVFGAVYLRVVTIPLISRLIRYGVMAMLVFMAALVVVVLGIAHTALRRANANLDLRARELAAANDALRVQIDERERAEQALRQSQKMEAMGQLVGGVAHDFNNLLMTVSSGLRLLEKSADGERRNMILESIEKAVDRGAGLTRQLLAFARRQKLKPQVIHPGKQVEGMRELLERSLREDISVTLRTPETLWPIKVDSGQFELVILNLAVNARDAMPNGGALTIEGENIIHAEDGRDREMVRLSVTDTGAGMSEETVARAFEPFFTTKDVDKGTGLGLSQVYGFASQSGGWAEIDSALDQGTTISLILPRSKEAPADDGQRDETPAPSSAHGAARVLLVEDDDNVARMVCELVELLGHDCRRVSSAAEALTALEENRDFDIMFSDIVMPGGMNGLELAERVRETWPDLPIILTTGYSEDELTLTADFTILRKPYAMEDLDRALARRLKPSANGNGGA
ncbi:MAG: response regulator [Euryhalocaulis sp.]|uniref:ATP-binding protein n=1 Tax=Euryhalocaulis sp. TaxID=2744307 RepID=UPI0018296974|nr:ATP-binding protein [Euryhalocaulis sp.]MBA4800496.1 response regulator [Euryhalocaulis sp.]